MVENEVGKQKIEMTGFKSITGIEELLERYDTFLVDQFGVLLHDRGAYPHAPDTLRRLSALGKRVVLLSNSGQRSAPNIQRLLSLGFSRSSFETVLTSGELAHSYLMNLPEAGLSRNVAVLVIAENPAAHLDALPLRVARNSEEAQLLLIAGSDPRHVSLESYRTLLAPLADKGIHCLCTNPDTIRLSQFGTTYGPGAVAELYEALGGTVHRIGKPYPMMYAAAFDWLGDVDQSGVVCVGDSPVHDIAGAQQAGLDSVLIRSGIHADESLGEIYNQCVQLQALPDFVLERYQFAS
ncbi:TIGR01459 family HAD-type hydrolase [Granulosicoccus antarcticus]|uniref:Phosphoglycolate phosphatase n=1 Tax=Granulosicoccus antarcticus IMCC3135 TaxID=1192854 RepID=A0A2Z2NSR4_9GAMM|nr:TIGR01459 family HAD-type hydrolase [Granulosicoccus antarcticus]ASJ74303.1 Phosphoglycolate phosphatase [Granulosicoccus antarcticus IMCC3135]